MKSEHDFSKSFLLLQKEGYLISNCLTTGLTELRSATIQQKGRFYVALFNIAVGIERLLKSILIINYMIENSLSVPTKNQLKEYGHNIHELIDSAFKIANIRGIDFSRIKECDEITLKILNLINDFAMTTRYYNLDALSSNTNYRDPLNYINEIYTDIFNSDVSNKTKEKINLQTAYLEPRIEDVSFTIATGLDGQKLSSTEFLMIPILNEQASRFMVFRIVELLMPMYELIRNLSYESYNLGLDMPVFPQMQEFLDWIPIDKKTIINKKKWP